MNVAPITGAEAALRVAIVGAAETELIAAVGATQDAEAAAPAPGTPAPPAQPDPVRQAVDTAKAQAAGRQASLAPLFADLSQALAHPDLPATIKAVISQILAFQLPADVPLTAETIRQAVAQSGLFLEAHLAQAEPDAPAPPDLKAALLTLLKALPEPPPGAPPPPQRTAPPVRDGALQGQAPVSAGLPDDADIAAVVGRLRPEVEQALARQTLHQLASLPDSPASAWMFELPIATPQGAAIAQFEVERDTSEDGAAETAQSWRVRFSLDIEPLGPVHVHLGMSGERASVTLWAEREASVVFLRSQGEGLARALPGDVAFRLGAPRVAPPASGRFVDRSS